MNGFIINFAPTGVKPTKELTPYVPISVDEIVGDVIKAYNMGVQMVHIHAKDKDGNNTLDKDIYSEIIAKIRTNCDKIVICVSLSGRFLNTFEARSSVLDLEGIFKPDMGSLTLSSLNFYDGESVNSPDMIMALAIKMNEKNIKPELEVFDSGMINYAKYLIKKGILKPPYYFNIIVGNISSAQATLNEIGYMISILPENSIFSIGGIGKFQYNANIVGLMYADGIRIGLEDNIYYPNSTELISNTRMIEIIIEHAKLMNRKLLSHDEVISKLNL